MEEATLKGLKVFEEGKIDDIRIGSRIKWFKKGHVAIKESFVLLKDWDFHTLILELKLKQGQSLVPKQGWWVP